MASYCLVNDIPQELSATLASLKRGALNYFLNVFPDCRSVLLSGYDFRKLCFANTAGIQHLRPPKTIFSPFLI